MAVHRECAQRWKGGGWVWTRPVSSLQVSEPSTRPTFILQRPPHTAPHSLSFHNLASMSATRFSSNRYTTIPPPHAPLVLSLILDPRKPPEHPRCPCFSKKNNANYAYNAIHFRADPRPLTSFYKKRGCGSWSSS